MRARSILPGAISLGAGIVSACFAACATTGLDVDALRPGSDGGVTAADYDAAPCRGLECQRASCPSGGTTTLSGTVYDPAGQVPLFGAIVYVPNAPLVPVTHGATCDACDATITAPVTSTTTDENGHFVLENVPVTSNLPLVMQIGKWRRPVQVPFSIEACTDNPILDPSLTRMPRNQSEGDLPRFALATGACDAFECLLRKIGISDSEFTAPGAGGSVSVYQGFLAGDDIYSGTGPGAQLPAGSPPAKSLWSDPQSLMGYDVALFACECAPNAYEKPPAALQAVFDFANAGGRIFASHFQYYWLESGVEPFPATATWNHEEYLSGDPLTAAIDDSTPKVASFEKWMYNIGASPTLGRVVLDTPKGDVAAINPATSTRWMYDSDGTGAVLYYSFQTPIGTPTTEQCGRVVYSDLHVTQAPTSNSHTEDIPGEVFPQGCLTTGLSPQEKALEFMLFDLSSCVQQPPAPIALPPPPQ